MKKQPRAQTREGRPSSALGGADHRARKVAVPKAAIPAAPIDEIPMTGSETEEQVRLVEAVNRLVRDYNEDK